MNRNDWYVFVVVAAVWSLLSALVALDFSNALTPADRIVIGGLAVVFDIVAGHLAWLAEKAKT